MLYKQIKKRWYLALVLLLPASILEAAGTAAPKKGAGATFLTGAWNVVNKVDWAKHARTAGKAVGDTVREVGDVVDRETNKWKDAQQKRFEAEMKANQEKQARLERQLLDKSLPKDYRAMLMRQQEATIQEAEDARKKNQQRQEQIEDMVMGTMQTGANTLIAQAGKAGDHSRNLEAENAKAFQHRKGMSEAVVAGIKEAMSQFRQNPHYILGAFGGCVTLFYGIKFGAEYINDQLRLPTLAEETSMISRYERFVNWMTGAGVKETKLTDVILSDEAQDQINTVAGSLGNIVANNSYLPHIMLWGPPGTGKTMVAKRLARSCGLDYLYFTAAAFDQFSLEEVMKHITHLFESAKRNKKRLMIIIDEAEVALVQRGPDLPEKTRKIVTHLLGYTGTETRDYMVMFMTNRPEDLDEAIVNRVDYKIRIDTPGDVQREAILKLYINKFIKNGEHLRHEPKGILDYLFSSTPTIIKATLEEDLFTDEYIREISDKIAGFVGRDISKLVLAFLNAAYTTADCFLSKDMVNKVLTAKLRERDEKEQGFKRDAVPTRARVK